MNLHQRVIAAFAAASLSSLVVGCDVGSSGSPSVAGEADRNIGSSIPVPAVLDVRDIDRDALFPIVTANDRDPLRAERGSDGTWRILFEASPNSRVELSITWLERFQGTDLRLTRGLFGIAVGETDLQFQVSSAQYDDSIFDLDNDGVSNLDERRNNTDPTSADSRARSFDLDRDGVAAGIDNCDGRFNPRQHDLDGDAIGDDCDPDIDGDGIVNQYDNCPLTADPDQSDIDNDGIGDVCDSSS